MPIHYCKKSGDRPTSSSVFISAPEEISSRGEGVFDSSGRLISIRKIEVQTDFMACEIFKKKGGTNLDNIPLKILSFICRPETK